MIDFRIYEFNEALKITFIFQSIMCFELNETVIVSKLKFGKCIYLYFYILISFLSCFIILFIMCIIEN